MSDQLDKFGEYLVSLFLILTGLVGVVIGIADFVGWDTELITPKLVLLTVGLLATALGLERVGRFRRYGKQIEQFEQLFARSRGGQHLIGNEEIYRSAIRLCSTVKNQIRTIILASSTKSPPAWPEAVAKRLRETKRAGNPIIFEAVIGVDFDHKPADFDQGIERRLELYERQGVKDLVNLRLMGLKPPIGFDILIFDREHVIIAFTPLVGVKVVQTALLFENQPQIASEFADWFDQIIFRSASNPS